MRLYEFDVDSGKTRELLTPEQVLKGAEEHLTPEEKARRERQRVSVGGFTTFHLSDDGALILVSLSGRLYVVERSSGAVRELATGKGVIVDPKFSPDGKSVAYVRDQDVYVYDLAAAKEHRVTTGGTEKLTHGLAEFVAQEEMNRFTGYWWSPDSKSIAYEEADASEVEVWHLSDPRHPENPPQAISYPRPGKANVTVRLGVVPVSGGETTWIDWDVKKYPYLAFVRWDKHGPLTLAVQTREQQELALLAADPKTGKTTTLLVERDSTWVNLPRDAPRWLPNGAGFLWISDRSGPQLELRDTKGALVRVLAAPSTGFESLIDVDPQTGQVVNAASTEPTH
jgi:dipeptidyl-peptidase-4